MTLEEARTVGDIVAGVINKSSHAGCKHCEENAAGLLTEKFPSFSWTFHSNEPRYITSAKVESNGP